MRILVSAPAFKDIGPLDGALLLPMAGRLRRDIKTVCDACGNPITDEYFVAGFKSGHPNLKIHKRCADREGVKVTERLPE